MPPAHASTPILQTTLKEVRIGKVAPLNGTDILSGIAKAPCAGATTIHAGSVEGDEYGSPHLHGGDEQVILHYPEAHYAFWRTEFPESAALFVPGGFGENFVADGFDETNVCIGDVMEVGTTRLQVSMPRQPCFRLNHRFEQKSMARRVQQTRKTGWYYRVLRPGVVNAGDTLTLVERPLPEWTISEIQHFLYGDTGNGERLAVLSQLPYLAPLMKDLFKQRLISAEVEDWDSRLADARASASPDAATNAWQALTVNHITDESSRVRSFMLATANGQALPGKTAGAHIRVRLPNGLVRAYSLCDIDNGSAYKIAVSRADEGRGGSTYLHSEISAGDTLEVSAPVNSFPVDASAGEHIMIAGGIGITPFLAMMQHFRLNGMRFKLYYLNRRESDAAFVTLLRETYPSETHFHFSEHSSPRRFDVAALVGKLAEDAHLYCCGSESLLKDVEHATAHMARDRVHIEAFSAPALANDARAFSVRIQSTGKVIPVGAHQTILSALRENGLFIESACETGSCGTCVMSYSEGVIEHHDTCLTAKQRASQIALCVSRAKSDVVTIDA